MSKRRCENCLWFYRVGTGMVGECRRYPPQHPQICRRWLTVEQSESCGEWQDDRITPEQAERRELVRQFAVAIVASDPEGDTMVHRAWQRAAELADYEGQT